MKNNPKKLGLILLWLGLIIFCSTGVLVTISFFSAALITTTWRYILLGVLAVSLVIILIALVLLNKNKYCLKFKKWFNVLFTTLVSLYAIGCCGFLFLLYGPFTGFKTWLITTAMMTMNHQYLCKWFYNDNIIAAVLNENYIEEFTEDTDASLVDFVDVDLSNANEYEKEILIRKKDDIYKIITFEVNGCKAYLAAIYNPKNISVGVTKWFGRSGQYAYDMAKENNAILAINGGGFIDPGHNSKGATPVGVTIQNGKLITSSGGGGNIIGFNKDGVLMLKKNRGGTAALADGYYNAVTMTPFLIVNGKAAFIKGNGGWGYAARTAIGQRADGIVLFLVVDSNGTRSKGASMLDLTQIMQRYGAINAANLDGGTSSVMVLPKEEASKYTTMCEDENLDYCWINDPIDSAFRHRSRGIPTVWLVKAE